MAPESRRYPRISKLLLVSYVSASDGRQTSPISMGRILDMNQAGLGLEVFSPIAVGAEMEMEIDLNGELIAANGEVIHCREADDRYILGIRFYAIHDKLSELSC